MVNLLDLYAKVCVGCGGQRGGHQDNVFEELHTFAEWSKKYGDKSQMDNST